MSLRSLRAGLAGASLAPVLLSLGLALASVALAFGLSGCSSDKRGGFDSASDGTDALDAGGNAFAGEAGKGNTNCAVNNVHAADLDTDFDGDGYPLRYDCNECDPNVNMGAFDVPGNNIDEDCNGVVDDEPADCDTGLPLGGTGLEGANAIGLCKQATNDQMWGVIEASWVKPDGSALPVPVGYGILGKFGPNNSPQAGDTLVAISSGAARAPGDSGFRSGVSYSKNYSNGTPKGYPKESPSCGGAGGIGDASDAHDGVALRVKVRVPSNARSFKFQQNFFTFEFPGYICTPFNDFFVTIMDPQPAGLPDGNISFDQDNNPISVNNSLLRVCDPQTAGGKTFSCPLGNQGLSGTGFESHASTGWLTTTAPVDTVRGKELTLTWMIWDQGDGSWDSTALIDDFSWSVDAADGTRTLPSDPK